MAQQMRSQLSGAKRRGSAHWDVDEFLAVVSHELRNSTNAIVTWADYLSKRPMSDDVLAGAAEAIKRNGKLQVDLIEQLLNLSRVRTGTLHFDPRSIPIVPVIEAAIETMVPQAAAKSVDLVTALDRSPATVHGDPLRLQEVFTNLLSNAIRFTPPGGRIELQCRPRMGYEQITVKDTGCGISTQFLPYVFERFRQEKRSSTESQGLGLGLAIARYVVDWHQGGIYAMSHGAGTGTTFRVYLPLERRIAGTRFNPLWSCSTDKLR